MSDKYNGKQHDRRYEGNDITITYSAKRCIHAAHCVNHLSDVFDTKKRPWINTNGADSNSITDVIEMCPSGALHYERNDGGNDETIPEENVILLRNNGELVIRGQLSIQGTTVDIQHETRTTLCRCGSSNNKPFCDNTHKEIGFVANEATQTQKTAQGERGGKLTITAHTNGPLEVVGNFRIENEAGDTIMAGNKTWLCRCGGSQKKPFCDSTHKANNFVAD